jgi:hypothetical protein
VIRVASSFWLGRADNTADRGAQALGAETFVPRAGSFSAIAPAGVCGRGLRGSRTNESGGRSSRRKSPQRRSERRKRSVAKTRLSRLGRSRRQVTSLRLRNRLNSLERRRAHPPWSDSPASTRPCRPESPSRSQPLRATRHRRSRLDERRLSGALSAVLELESSLGEPLLVPLAKYPHHVIAVVTVPLTGLEPKPLNVRVKDSLQCLEVASTPGLQPLAGDCGQLARHDSRIDPAGGSLEAETGVTLGASHRGACAQPPEWRWPPS